jgi:hypothetical protein
LPSSKNCQLVDRDQQDVVILQVTHLSVTRRSSLAQFGRVGKDEFTMDMQWPIAPFHAFGIALTSFDFRD